MEQQPGIGHRVVGTIKFVKGYCTAGHKEGEQFEISAHNTGGLCGFFYHDAFPYILMLQFGGGYPSEWGDPNVIQLECVDRANCVTLGLRRSDE